MPEVFLRASTTPAVVTIPRRAVLAYEGRGAPESEDFQRAFAALYGVAYTLKFERKRTGGHEFRLGPLEGRWWAEGEGVSFGTAPRDAWCWRLRLAVPGDVTADEVARAIHLATSRKGGTLEHSVDAPRVVLERLPAQRVGLALHVGPYAEEGRTFTAIEAVLAAAGITSAFSHLELYLSDPRRTPAARLKTVLARETVTARS